MFILLCLKKNLASKQLILTSKSLFLGEEITFGVHRDYSASISEKAPGVSSRTARILYVLLSVSGLVHE